MSRVLSSWKEIASHLGRGVRTVQRWEIELGLPVRRPKPKSHQIVLAFPDELDRWLHGQPKHQHAKPTATLTRTRDLLTSMVEQTRLASERTKQICQRVLVTELVKQHGDKCGELSGRSSELQVKSDALIDKAKTLRRVHPFRKAA